MISHLVQIGGFVVNTYALNNRRYHELLENI